MFSPLYAKTMDAWSTLEATFHMEMYFLVVGCVYQTCMWQEHAMDGARGVCKGAALSEVVCCQTEPRSHNKVSIGPAIFIVLSQFNPMHPISPV